MNSFTIPDESLQGEAAFGGGTVAPSPGRIPEAVIEALWQDLLSEVRRISLQIERERRPRETEATV